MEKAANDLSRHNFQSVKVAQGSHLRDQFGLGSEFGKGITGKGSRPKFFNEKTIPSFCTMLVSSVLITLNPVIAHAQGTAFTYQGRLNDGATPANGIYNLRFTVYDNSAGGSQQGPILTNGATTISNGLFMVTLDFGNQFPGANRWLEIGVRTNGGVSFFTLSPRQALTPAPYAITAENVAGTITVQNNTYDAPNIIGGSSINSVADGIVGATIAGGGSASDFHGFLSNNVTADFGTVGGGLGNSAGGYAATVGGGVGNNASGFTATVAGGNFNTASGVQAAVGGGIANTASGSDSIVPGGISCIAAGNESFAAGRDAQANHNGAFVWADDQPFSFRSTSSNQFLIRATGGVGIGTAGPETPLHIADFHGITLGTSATFGAFTALRIDLSAAQNGYAELQAISQAGVNFGNLILQANGGNVGIGTTTPGQKLAVNGNILASGTITGSSDRNVKEHFSPVSARDVLEKVSALPISEWNYKADNETLRHIGPMAQDFYAAFNVGMDDKHISMVDADGVALAAIQGLNQKLEETHAENAELKQQNDLLARRLSELESTVKQITARQ